MSGLDHDWAILADIHGNGVALDAVLAECSAEGLTRFIVPGDVAWGPDPRSVVEVLMAKGDQVAIVRGNADREVADPHTLDVPDLLPSTRWCSEQLTDEQRTWLRGLPLTTHLRIEGVGETIICHGTPTSDSGRLRPDIEPLEAEAALSAVTGTVVICGHSHVRFDVLIAGQRIVNPGSVGLHYGQLDAQWATIGPRGIAMRSTPYDREQAAAAVLRSGNPDAERFAAFFRVPVG